MPKYLTKKEAAELLRMTESTLDGYRRKGILPYIKMGIRSNSKVMFDEADLHDFMARRKVNTPYRSHGDGIVYNSGFTPGGGVISGSGESRGIPKEDVREKEREYLGDDVDYTDMPPDIY
jgi:hypothetical protein